MPTRAAVRWAVAANIIVFVIAVAFWVCDSAQTGTAIIQTLILSDTLWVLWLYTRATFTLATTAEDQMKFVKAQFIDTKVGELIRSKPIVVTDRNANRETLISNVGDAFATNVWYLAEGNQAPIPLGSLGEGQTRVVPIEIADRHVLIAEARQMPPGVARKFTPTLNVWTGHAFAHGFIQPSKNALEHRGSIADYLTKSPDLLETLAAYDPLRHDPDDARSIRTPTANSNGPR
jgi:hypothetical protein